MTNVTHEPKNQLVSIRALFAAILVFLMGWLSWGSIELIALGKTVASNGDIAGDLKVYKEAQDTKNDKVADSVADLKEKVATTNELVKLMSERYKIDSAAVEARVIEQINRESNLPTTTAIK